MCIHLGIVFFLPSIKLIRVDTIHVLILTSKLHVKRFCTPLWLPASIYPTWIIVYPENLMTSNQDIFWCRWNQKSAKTGAGPSHLIWVVIAGVSFACISPDICPKEVTHARSPPPAYLTETDKVLNPFSWLALGHLGTCRYQTYPCNYFGYNKYVKLQKLLAQ